MKRYGYLFEKIACFNNLLLAAQKAIRGKKDRPPIARFYFHLESELLQLEHELLAGTYTPQPFRTFMVHEPKARRICAAHIRDRVVHHAIFNLIDPIFERHAIFDSYACWQNRGSHQAMRRAQQFSRKCRYFLKLDVRKFFGSIDQQVLKDLLARKFKDKQLLALLGQIVEQPVPDCLPGKGMPIGNLTSQYFGNFYMSILDHFVKDTLGVSYFLRYMDDMLLFADDKAYLHQIHSQIRPFLNHRLLLDFKEETSLLAPVYQGMPFLGFRIYPGLIRLQRAGWHRFKRQVKKKETAYIEGDITEEHLIQSVQSMLAHVQHAQTLRLRRDFSHRSTHHPRMRSYTARTASYGAATSTITPRTCDPHSTIGTSLAIATTTLACAC